jgi:hypothetical protein
MDNEYVSKTELKQLTLISRLEDNVDALTLKAKQIEAEKDNAIDKWETSKLEIVKLSTANQLLMQKNESLEKENQTLKLESKEQVENLDLECEELHKMVFDIRESIIKDQSILSYYGSKADAILNDSFNEGKNILDIDYLKEKEFPLPLLIETEEEDFGIQTSNFKLVRIDDKYKLSKLNTYGERAQKQA